MLFIIQCVDKPGSQELRLKTRPEHIAYIHQQEDRVFLAGPTVTEDDSAMTGTVLIVNVADRAAAEALADGDPYFKAGLFASRTITPWRKITFNPNAG